MTTAIDTAAGKRCFRTATCTSGNTVTGLDTAWVRTSSVTAPDTTAIGDRDTNTVKGVFGILTERDTKVTEECTKIGSESDRRNDESSHTRTHAYAGNVNTFPYVYSYKLFLYRTSQKSRKAKSTRGIPGNSKQTRARDTLFIKSPSRNL